MKPYQEQTGVAFSLNGIDPKVVSYVAELPEENQDKWIKAYIKIKSALKQDEMQT